MEENYFDKSLENIFKNRDLGSYQKSVENARKNSVHVSNTVRKTRSVNVDMNKIKKEVIGILLVGVVILGGSKVFKALETDPSLNMDYLKKEIGSIVYEVPDNFNPNIDTTKFSILSQNTVRNGDIIYYNHESIAKDLLKLDPELFDYAFCTVINDMGSYRNNKVGEGGSTNIDYVISCLKGLSKDGKYSNEYVSKELKDVETLDDFLKRYGYTKNGEPSIEVFTNVCNNNAQTIRDFLESIDKGVKK